MYFTINIKENLWIFFSSWKGIVRKFEAPIYNNAITFINLLSFTIISTYIYMYIINRTVLSFYGSCMCFLFLNHYDYSILITFPKTHLIEIVYIGHVLGIVYGKLIKYVD